MKIPECFEAEINVKKGVGEKFERMKLFFFVELDLVFSKKNIEGTQGCNNSDNTVKAFGETKRFYYS